MKTNIKQVRTRRDWRTLKWAEEVCFEEDDRPEFHCGRWYLIHIDGEPAAFCAGEITAEGYFLSRAGVLPGWRGQGLQRVMIDYRIKLAKGRPVYTYTSADNVASMNNLIACGFRIDSVSEDGFINWRLYEHSDLSGEG